MSQHQTELRSDMTLIVECAEFRHVQPESLKYADAMSQLSSCPPDSVRAIEGKVFRFFHEDTLDERNYLPPAKLQPTRKWKDDEESCDGFGLSMFFSQEKAEAYFSELRLAVPNIGKRIGSHVATARIEKNDGVATPEDKVGHFSLFESSDCSLKNRFELVKALV